MDKRKSGILLHITALYGEYGIGSFGKEAYEFVDFLKKSGQSYWQILPLGITGFGDSPYQSVSAFAGNYFLINLDKLIEEGFLYKSDLENLDFKDDDEFVNYDKVFETRTKLLRKAYDRKFNDVKEDVLNFVESEKNWLKDFALYMAIKKHFLGKPWNEWDEKYRDNDEETLLKFKEENMNEIEFWYFIQYLFFKQWHELKSYANSNGIEIIGDLPIYVAFDSSDVWKNQSEFLLDELKKPKLVSGCPPDSFAPTGQYWGNPIYNWNEMKKNNYKWWIDRMKASTELFDIVRIDHFRGFEAYWEIPSHHETAEFGRWTKGPGNELFKAIENALGKLNIIAEDLGYMTEEFYKFKDETGFPGMNILQFAFDTRDENNYLPHYYVKNSICYTGTHDNNTIMGWFNDEASDEEKKHAIEYLNLTEEEGINFGFIRGCFASVSNTAIIPLQDYLALGSEARFNIPSTVGGNWIWRMKREYISEDLARKIYRITKLYGRI
ncbi:MAG: 4-alpha-glucanotransferase [Fusobacteriia bacterium 4572_132]|nr:MAG: 4-alpha-glucanotransferase [Fusobacteriia bacterium 4572_132]